LETAESAARHVKGRLQQSGREVSMAGPDREQSRAVSLEEGGVGFGRSR
jgi:hypothetical protein